MLKVREKGNGLWQRAVERERVRDVVVSQIKRHQPSEIAYGSRQDAVQVVGVEHNRAVAQETTEHSNCRHHSVRTTDGTVWWAREVGRDAATVVIAKR